MKIIAIIIILFLQVSYLSCQIEYDNTVHNIEIQDSSFKSLLASYIGKTGKDFVDEMYHKGYIYESLSCNGDKINLIHWITVQFIDGVSIRLFIGEHKIKEFDEFEIPIRRFNSFNMYNITMIKVEKRTVELAKPIFQSYYINREGN